MANIFEVEYSLRNTLRILTKASVWELTSPYVTAVIHIINVQTHYAAGDVWRLLRCHVKSSEWVYCVLLVGLIAIQ
jgi:hypothetical protein